MSLDRSARPTSTSMPGDLLCLAWACVCPPLLVNIVLHSSTSCLLFCVFSGCFCFSVWFQWLSPFNGVVFTDLNGLFGGSESDYFQGSLDVFTAQGEQVSLDTLDSAQCSDGCTSVTVMEGVRYFIRVSGNIYGSEDRPSRVLDPENRTASFYSLHDSDNDFENTMFVLTWNAYGVPDNADRENAVQMQFGVIYVTNNNVSFASELYWYVSGFVLCFLISVSCGIFSRVSTRVWFLSFLVCYFIVTFLFFYFQMWFSACACSCVFSRVLCACVCVFSLRQVHSTTFASCVSCVVCVAGTLCALRSRLYT